MRRGIATDTETVLRIGAEGGSLSVKRLRAPDGTWRFQAMKNEIALVEMLGDEGRGLPGIANVGPGATSFREALRALDRYPWPKLTLITVHRGPDIDDGARAP